jgi:hypothetical protein
MSYEDRDKTTTTLQQALGRVVPETCNTLALKGNYVKQVSEHNTE